MALAVCSAVVAALWRQNAVITLGLVVGGVVVLAVRSDAGGVGWSGVGARVLRSKKAIGLAALLAGCVAAVGLLVAAGAVYRASGVVITYPQRQLWVYDLAGISVRTGHDAFPSDVARVVPNREGVIPPDISESGLKRLFDPTDVLTLYYPSGNWARGLNDGALARQEESELFGRWVDRVTSSPTAYLYDRLEMLGGQLGFLHRPMDGFVGLMQSQNYGYPLEHPSQYRAATDYLDAFLGPSSTIPLDITWPYLFVGTASLVLIRRRVRPAVMITGLTLLVSAWLSVLVFGVVGVAVSFRYSILAVPTGLILLVWAAAYRWHGARVASRPS
jgi:hypothetical protein